MALNYKVEPAVYTVPEIAAMLRINVTRAYELTKQKDFPAIKIGRRIVVPKVAFERWLEETAFDKKSSE